MKNLTKRACAILVTAVVLVVLGSCIIPQQEIDNSDWLSILVPGSSMQLRINSNGNSGARSLGGIDFGEIIGQVVIADISMSSISLDIHLQNSEGSALGISRHDLSRNNEVFLLDNGEIPYFRENTFDEEYIFLIISKDGDDIIADWRVDPIIRDTTICPILLARIRGRLCLDPEFEMPPGGHPKPDYPDVDLPDLPGPDLPTPDLP